HKQKELEQVRKRGLPPLLLGLGERGQAPLPDLFYSQRLLCLCAFAGNFAQCNTMRKPLLLALALITCFLTTAHVQNEQAKREDAYRANNLGVALLEQFKHKEAADAFRRALQLDPGLVLSRINLGIALFNIPDLPAAQKELQAAIQAAPTAPQPHYLLGLAAKLQ